MIKEIVTKGIPAGLAVTAGLYMGMWSRQHIPPRVDIKDGKPASSAPAHPGYYDCKTNTGSQSGLDEWDCTNPYQQALINITPSSAKVLTQDFRDPTISLHPLRGSALVEAESFTDTGKRFSVEVVFDRAHHNRLTAVKISP